MATDDEILSQEQEVVRGRKAKALMQNPLMVEAFETLEREFYRAFQETDPRDMDGLLKIRLLFKCLQEFRGFFSTLIETGQLTTHNIGMAQDDDRISEMLERQRLRG